MRNKPSYLSIALLLFLMSGLLYLRYPELVTQPNSYLSGAHGDGYKNYITPVYHVKYDSSYYHFQGMPYPYGDHVIFSDNQPLISNTLRFLYKRGFEVEDKVLGVLNYSMLFSILICSLLLYLIWRRLGLPRWLAMLGAIGISFLSPQLLRMVGHYGLSHAFILPAIMLLLLLYEEQARLRLSLLIALLIMAAAMLHFYFFGICTFFVMTYMLIRTMRNGWRKAWRWNLLNLTVQIGLPLIIMSWWVFGGEAAVERPASPYGFLDYRMFWEGLLLPHDLPLGKFVSRHIIDVRQLGIEGYAYLGGLAIIGMLIMAYRKVSGLRPIVAQRRAHQNFLTNNTYAAFLILLFALGLPFIIPSLDALIPYTGPLQQFRGIGRFAWVFYYAINIYVLWYLFFVLKSISKIWLRRVLSISILLIVIVDILSYLKAHPLPAEQINKFTDQLGLKRDGWLKYIDPDDFQAILPIPFFHIGSENFWIMPEGKILEQTLTASLQSGLPTVAALMTRVPLDRSLKAIELMYPPLAPPSILPDLPNKKPLLILVDKASSAGSAYAHLLEDARFLYENEQLQFYSLSLVYLERAASTRAIRLKLGMEKRAIFQKGNFYITDSLGNYIYKGFDEKNAAPAFWQTPKSISPDDAILFESKLQNLAAGKYLLSFWIDLSEDLNPLSDLHLQIDGAIKQYHIRNLLSAIEGGRGLVEVPFEKVDSAKLLTVRLQKHSSKKGSVKVDNLLIRSEQDSIYGDFGEQLFFNNRWYKKSKD